MLSENQVVAVRNAIEMMYDGTCTIIEQEKFTKADKSKGFRDKTVIENQPCKLSISSITSTNQTESAASVVQTARLFIAPEIQIKPGSKITVTQNGVTTAYKNSGEPAIYKTHQEIILELFKGWA